MSNINTALDFLRSGNARAAAQWTSGAPLSSMLQREQMSFEELLGTFDPTPDSCNWEVAYKKGNGPNKLRKYRNRVSFLNAARKEFREDYDSNVTDVDFIRLLEIPYTESNHAIDLAKDCIGESDNTDRAVV